MDLVRFAQCEIPKVKFYSDFVSELQHNGAVVQ